MPPAPWSHPATEELLGLAVDLLVAGDRRALTLLGEVLGRECGPQFAATVTSALAGGAPLEAFDFLPAPSRQVPVPAAEASAASDPPDASASPVAARPAPQSAEPRPQRQPRHRTLAPGPPPPLPESGYVTAVEVAAHFGVSVKAVYRWMATGRIRAERRPGGSYRIPADQFKAKELP